MSAFRLRDYQQRAVELIRAAWEDGDRRVLLALPTGGGKTEVAISIAAQEAERCLVVVDRKVLAHQWRARFVRHGFNHVGLLQGDNTVATWAPILVGTAQTIRSRGIPENVGFIVIDESHIWHETHDRVLDACTGARVLGLSATPLRDGLGKRFDRLVVGATIRELTDRGHLVPARIYAPHPEEIERALESIGIRAGDYIGAQLSELMRARGLIGSVIETWQGKALDRQTIAFCCDKQHARDMADAFALAGVPAATVVDETPDEERTEIFQQFDAGEIRVLASVGVLGIGFDSPIASCAILARPTLSTMLHIQQCGRVIRPCAGKADALILDHAANTLRHGRPIDFEPPPDLSMIDKSTDRKARTEISENVVCRNCEAVYPRIEEVCPECLTPRRRYSTEVVLDGQLVRYDSFEPPPPEIAAAATPEQVRRFYAEMLALCDTNGWKRGAAWFKTCERFGLRSDYSDPITERVLPKRFRFDCDPVQPSLSTIHWVDQQKRAYFARQRYAKGAHA